MLAVPPSRAQLVTLKKIYGDGRRDLPKHATIVGHCPQAAS